MKLIQKVNRKYAIFSIFLLVAGLAIIYLAVMYYIGQEIDEELFTTKINVIKSIQTGNIPQYYPFIEVKKLNNSVPEIRGDILTDVNIFDVNEKEYDPFRQLVTCYHGKEGYYLITLRLDEIQKGNILLPVVITGAFLLLLAVVLSSWYVNRLSKKLWEPFYDSLRRLKTFSVANRKPVVFQPSEVVEFNDLNNCLNELTQAVFSDYSKLQEFSQNASHELQTPLAIIRAKLEALYQRTDLDESIIAHLNSINASISRLAVIYNSLTLLTRLQSKEYDSKSLLRVKDILKRITDEFTDIVETREITLTLESTPEFSILMNEELLVILFSNLMSNCVKHNHQKGYVKILSTEQKLIFQNSGHPLNKPPAEMFYRFMKGDPSLQSTGLGLSIVKQICDSNNIEVEYINEGNIHTITLTFPKF
ncbi:MAG: HAMP domain-containing histidine kinase [Ignavibacteria bacterium]|nr:HAMP domain-containing histidine kinase [Ignavibacteria bacterium]